MGLRHGICYFGALAVMKIYTPGDCIHCAAWTRSDVFGSYKVEYILLEIL